MGMPLFAADALFSPLQQLVRSLARRLRRPAAPQAASAVVPMPHPRCAAPGPLAHRAAPARRLRVVRVVEASQAAATAGRMVISGRMADVCAELERLAALEAAAG